MRLTARRFRLCLYCLFVATTASAQTVTVTTLEGESLSGELAGLTQDGLKLLVDGDERSLAVNALMQVDFNPAEGKPASADAPLTVTLTNQSALKSKTVTFDGAMLTLNSPTFGALSFPVRDLRAVRFGEIDDKVAEGWRDLTSRNSRDDLLAFRKGDILDYVSGAIGKIDDKGISIRVRDRDLSATLDRVFGVVFTQRSDPPKSPGIGVTTIHGETVRASGVALTPEGVELALASGAKLSAPLTDLSSLDFGGGRIRFLADLPADESDSKSPDEEYSVVWFTSANAPAGSGGRDPLVIGDRTTRKGLWLHGGAVVRYRLNREFARFKCLAGFERTHAAEMPRFEPRVKLTVVGDGSELYAREFGWNDPPQPLDLAIGEVRELVIRIESAGRIPGILEHFALGDAQVIQ